jgi:predicted GNAT family N-acyltransferase
VTATVARVERPEDLEAAFALRFAVFVEEQGVAPELELDALETNPTHLVAREDGAVVGTLRWREVTPGVGKVERVAVRRDRRGQGVGVLLMEAVLAELAAAGLREAVLHAQVTARAFYERLGFRAEGEPFEEDGIAHVRMMRRPLAPA